MEVFDGEGSARSSVYWKMNRIWVYRSQREEEDGVDLAARVWGREGGREGGRNGEEIVYVFSVKKLIIRKAHKLGCNKNLNLCQKINKLAFV
jgi:hypothetical protein